MTKKGWSKSAFMSMGMRLHGGWKFCQSMSLDSAVLGGAVAKRQVWMDGQMEGSIRRRSDRHP